jgi:hypothetical protein
MEEKNNKEIKPIIASFDDFCDENNRWDEILEVKKAIPELKVTLFAISGKCSPELLEKSKQDWVELAFHSLYHDFTRTDDWLNWDKEEAKKVLTEVQQYGFVKGIKFPQWRFTIPCLDACKELGFWICLPISYPSLNYLNLEVKKRLTKFWVTIQEGFSEYDDYFEFWYHTYSDELPMGLNKLKEYCKENKVLFKFMSEVVSENPPAIKDTNK